MRLRMETPNPLEEVVKEQGSRLEFLEETLKEYRARLEKLEALLPPEFHKSITEKDHPEEVEIDLPNGHSEFKRSNNQDTGVTTKLVQTSEKRSHHSEIGKTEILKKRRLHCSDTVPTTISTFEENSHSKKGKGGKLNDAFIALRVPTKPACEVDHPKQCSGHKRFKCMFCPKSFVLKNVLENHMRIHTGEKPFSCEICRKSFSQKPALTSHRRTHTGKKPYVCELCKKSFSRIDALNRHRRTHSWEKSFMCKLCRRTFRTQGGLNIHIRTHAGENPFACQICRKVFWARSHIT